MMTFDRTKPMLVTCTNWFVAPNGEQYNSVWGIVQICSDQELLQVKTNAQSSNWYAVIGKEDKQVIVAGCQIRYACVCINPPHTGLVPVRKITEDGKVFDIERSCFIYLAQ